MKIAIQTVFKRVEQFKQFEQFERLKRFCLVSIPHRQYENGTERYESRGCLVSMKIAIQTVFKRVEQFERFEQFKQFKQFEQFEQFERLKRFCLVSIPHR